MKNVNEFLLLTFFLVIVNEGCYGTIDHPYEIGTWQGFHTAAVSYTFDDSCSNQLALAVPMFDEFGFKLTLFTLTGCPSWAPANWPELQAAAANGHEVASHTVSHSDLSTLTTAQQTNELVNSQSTINSHIPGNQCVTIAYPYCVPGNQSLTATYYIAARTCSGPQR